MTDTPGLRPREPFPWIRRGMRLVRTHGRIFAFPAALELPILDYHRLFSHPAVLSADTLDEIDRLIDLFDVTPFLPVRQEPIADYRVELLDRTLYAVPPAAVEPCDLNVAEDRRRNGVLSAPTREQLEEVVAKAKAATPVEFAGWLPIYEMSGNCGRHPQFSHVDSPPEGYRFTVSAPAKSRPPAESLWQRTVGRVWGRAASLWHRLGAKLRPLNAVLRGGPKVGLRARWRTVRAMIDLARYLRSKGIAWGVIASFLQSRHLQSQLLMAKTDGIAFLTSMPYTYGRQPWVIEIEDPTTLFYPMIQNGNTCGLVPQDSPFFAVIKALLEHDSCKAILTHMRSTAECLPTLFGSDAIAKKIVYNPLGVKVPARRQRHDGDDEVIDLLFINSWCQVPENFHLRGGLDILEAFDILRVRYPQLRLTMRTDLPALDGHYRRIIEKGWVRVIDRFMSTEEMAELHAESHIFLLPAARVHIVSLLQAMSYGLAVVGSDGWGMEEYLEDGRNGLVVRGRYGKVTWEDREAGLLREDYEPMYSPNPDVVQGIVEAVSRLVEDRQLRRRLGERARADVEERYDLAQWNRGLARAFAMAAGAAAESPESATVEEAAEVA